MYDVNSIQNNYISSYYNLFDPTIVVIRIFHINLVDNILIEFKRKNSKYFFEVLKKIKHNYHLNSQVIKIYNFYDKIKSTIVISTYSFQYRNNSIFVFTIKDGRFSSLRFEHIWRVTSEVIALVVYKTL